MLDTYPKHVAIAQRCHVCQTMALSHIIVAKHMQTLDVYFYHEHFILNLTSIYEDLTCGASFDLYFLISLSIFGVYCAYFCFCCLILKHILMNTAHLALCVFCL